MNMTHTEIVSDLKSRKKIQDNEESVWRLFVGPVLILIAVFAALALVNNFAP